MGENTIGLQPFLLLCPDRLILCLLAPFLLKKYLKIFFLRLAGIKNNFF